MIQLESPESTPLSVAHVATEAKAAPAMTVMRTRFARSLELKGGMVRCVVRPVPPNDTGLEVALQWNMRSPRLWGDKRPLVR